MSVKFFNEEIKFNLKHKALLKKWINNAIVEEKFKNGAINFIFTSQEEILRINQKYLDHNYFTDIITFNYCENDIINGDVYICIETVKNNSTCFNVTFSEELHRVIIHGVLHLVGYNDQKEEEKHLMREKENFYLERLKNLF